LGVGRREWAKAHFFVGDRAWRAMKEDVLARVREIAQRVGDSEGIEIVDVEVAGGGRNRVLRIFIDKPAGVTHADCESISQQVGTILDVEDAMPGGSYTLEVSSPGVERKLSRPQDFLRFQGRKVKVVLREPLDDRRNWEGVLAGFSEGVIRLEPSPGKEISFDMRQVQRANLKFEW
jgi:ribosome maturation factor RimP